MKFLTYNLANNQCNSDKFYETVSKLTDEITVDLKIIFLETTLRYSQFVENKNIEKLRKPDEYLLELLMLGVLWNTYYQHSQAFPSMMRNFFVSLHSLRNNKKYLKPTIDKLRGLLMHFILKRKSEQPIDYNLHKLSQLIAWLEATCDFKEESIRLKNWLLFFQTLNFEECKVILQQTFVYAQIFTSKTHSKLNTYTSEVQFFLKDEKTYKFREDAIFCKRKEVEYHLNMIGAEILNRAFEKEFNEKPHKIVLLPACMRNANDCKAVRKGEYLFCAICRKNCNIGLITSNLQMKQIETVIIPHSSEFTRWLKQWENSKTTALVGVACVLNLLTGGYEMRKLNIASQCVFLDYCSCKNHWLLENVYTNLNINRLIKIIEK